jgi:UDP-N-acetylglucosamine 3-dehydrogenase
MHSKFAIELAIMRPLKVGVIGLGWFGEIHCDTIMGIPDLELVALSTRNEKRLVELSTKYGVTKASTDYNQLIEDPEIDAIAVTTKWNQHTQITLAALKAGKHVFLEKPIASTVAEAEMMIKASHDSPGILFVGHICRFNPRYRAAKKAIVKGAIGDIVSIRTSRNLPKDKTHLLLQHSSPFTSDAVHDLDLIFWLVGESSADIFAQSNFVRGLNYPDVAQIMMKFDSGLIANLEVNWHLPATSPYEVDESLKVVGTLGSIDINGLFPTMSITGIDGLKSPDTTYWPSYEGKVEGALRDEYVHFRQCVNDLKLHDFGQPHAALLALRAAIAAELSSKSGEKVRIH